MGFQLSQPLLTIVSKHSRPGASGTSSSMITYSWPLYVRTVERRDRGIFGCPSIPTTTYSALSSMGHEEYFGVAPIKPDTQRVMKWHG
jgi:hypothetical protein